MVKSLGNRRDSFSELLVVFCKLVNLHECLHLVVQLAEIEACFHNHVLVLILGGRIQVLDLVDESKAALANLPAHFVLVAKYLSLD